MLRPHIVILGAGFGGVYVAKQLASAVKAGEIDVTIVNRTNSFLFTPLLHEVATGGLNPRTVAEPLREIFLRTNIRVVEGIIDSINTADRNVSVKTELHAIALKYDYLVVATGAETNYYGITGAAEHALPLKTLRDAAVIRNRVIDAMEQAVTTDDSDQRKSLLSFAVIGGGATGVELAAELAEFVQGMVERYYGNTHCRSGDPRHCKSEEYTITLVNASKDLLEQFTPSLRRSALVHLVRKGVTVKLATSVTAIANGGITISTGEIIPASTVIWTAGVKATVPDFKGVKPTLTGGRMAVDNYFRILGSENVFAMGDVAAYIDSHQTPASQGTSANTKPLPQLAQVAEAEAETVAVNLLASVRGGRLNDFHYHSKGSMVSIGQWFALGEIFSMNMAGCFTWWLWRTVYLFKFASWKKRVRISLEWLLESFFPRDITKIN